MLVTKNGHYIHNLLASGLLLLMALNTFAESSLRFEGRAIDPKTSDLLYIENHQVSLNDAGAYVSAFVTYSYPDGEVFAEKNLDYTKNLLAPDMVFYDKRSGERTHVSLNTADAYLQVVIEANQKRKQSRVKLDNSLIVVDAGFDRLIESRWGFLRKEKELKFTFLAVTRAQLINFEALEEKASDSSITIALNPRNFFINLLVEPIVLVYDINNQHLLSFEGLTNIEIFKDGQRTEENYIARIDYSYQPLKVR